MRILMTGFFVLMVSLPTTTADKLSAATTRLAVKEGKFTVNGKPTFLYGISYYAALGAPEKFIEQDLKEMKKLGFNWIRVWATWHMFDNNISAVDEKGNPREPYFAKLKWLVKKCERMGMVVDVTLSRGSAVNKKKVPYIMTLEDHGRAVENIVKALKPHGNWFIDLANERNFGDNRFVSMAELAKVSKVVKRIDAERLVTASHVNDIDREGLRNYLLKVKVDFISPHRERNAKSPGQTKAKSGECIKRMEEIGRVVPILYQEPFRRGHIRNWEPTPDDFVTDARGAFEGQAAGWCFHNGDQRHKPDGKPRRSFDMREKRLFDNLDDEERKAIRMLSDLFRGKL